MFVVVTTVRLPPLLCPALRGVEAAEASNDCPAGPGAPQLQPGGRHLLAEAPGGLVLLPVAGHQGPGLGGEAHLSLPANLVERDGEEREGLGEAGLGTEPRHDTSLLPACPHHQSAHWLLHLSPGVENPEAALVVEPARASVVDNLQQQLPVPSHYAGPGRELLPRRARAPDKHHLAAALPLSLLTGGCGSGVLGLRPALVDGHLPDQAVLPVVAVDDGREAGEEPRAGGSSHHLTPGLPTCHGTDLVKLSREGLVVSLQTAQVSFYSRVDCQEI